MPWGLRWLSHTPQHIHFTIVERVDRQGVDCSLLEGESEDGDVPEIKCTRTVPVFTILNTFYFILNSIYRTFEDIFFFFTYPLRYIVQLYNTHSLYIYSL